MTHPALLATLVLACQTAHAHAHAYDRDGGDPQPARDDDQTFALDEQGGWEVSDFSEPVNRRLVYVGQLPPPGERHEGLASVPCEVWYVDPEDPGRGVQHHAWSQRLVDETPPVLEVELSANLEPSLSPGGATMFVVDDERELRVRLRVLTHDTVDAGVAPTAHYLDEAMQDVAIDLVYDDDADRWENDVSGLLVDGSGAWITIESRDASGNASTYVKYVEIHDEPFHRADLDVVRMTWEQTGADEFMVRGRLRVASNAFDVRDLHPDTLSLFFEDEDGRPLEPIDFGLDDDCCGDEDPGGPEDLVILASGTALELDFVEWLPALPGAIELMGRSTYDHRHFAFLARARAVWREGAGEGARAPNRVSPLDDPPPPPPPPPAPECKAIGYLELGDICYDLDSSGGYCADANYPGAFYAYAFAEVVVQGGDVHVARGHAEDRCDFNAEEAVASCVGEGKMVIRCSPEGCATGPVDVVSRPRGTCRCDVKKGEAYAVMGIRFDPQATTRDPHVRSAVAAGGVHCLAKDVITGGGLHTPGGGFTIPIMIPASKKDAKVVTANPALVYAYECMSGFEGLVTAAAGIHVAANDSSLQLFDWTRARAEARVTDTRVATTVSFRGEDCETEEPVSKTLTWR